MIPSLLWFIPMAPNELRFQKTEAPLPFSRRLDGPNGTAGSLRGGTRCWKGEMAYKQLGEMVFKGWVHIP